jgi:hypothetical protein
MDESDLLGERGATAARRYLPWRKLPSSSSSSGFPSPLAPRRSPSGGFLWVAARPGRGEAPGRSPATRPDRVDAATKAEAYKQARHCLLASGKVRSVGRWGNGGGFAYFRGYAHIVYWAYHLDNLGQVGRVRLYAFKLPARKLNLLRRCTYVP